MRIIILVLCLAHVVKSLRLRPSWDKSQEESGRRRKSQEAAPQPEEIKNEKAIVASPIPETAPRPEESIDERDIPASPDPKKVCVVIAVANHPECKLHTSSNINHLRAHFGDRLDVILMHYDEQTIGWMEQLPGKAWYTKNVQKSIMKKGLKIPLMKEAFSSKEEMQQYDWIWALDEDTDILSINLETMFKDAAATEAFIVVPGELTIQWEWKPEQQTNTNSKSLTKVSWAGTSASDASLGCQPGDSQCRFAAADRKCKFTRVNFIEVTAPMFRPLALYTVLHNCYDCFDDLSIWGLSSMWCSFVARLQDKEASFGCARLDQHKFVHSNIKTMTNIGKYDARGKITSEYKAYASDRKNQVKKAHPLDWSGALKQTCVEIEGLTKEEKAQIFVQGQQDNEALELQAKESKAKAKAQAAAQGLSDEDWGALLTGAQLTRARVAAEPLPDQAKVVAK